MRLIINPLDPPWVSVLNGISLSPGGPLHTPQGMYVIVLASEMSHGRQVAWASTPQSNKSAEISHFAALYFKSNHAERFSDVHILDIH